jgi:hypothetical protein
MNPDTSPNADAVTVTPSADRPETALFSAFLSLSECPPTSGQWGERAAEPPRSPSVGLRAAAAVRLGL